jgi:hypothetical protein
MPDKNFALGRIIGLGNFAEPEFLVTGTKIKKIYFFFYFF